ncbi:MAG: M56 family metallopeptidase, partial [Planctomycetota bacterium]
MDAYIKQVVDYLLSQSWQIAVITVLVALITFLLRNKSAHVRYLLWLIVLIKCLVPPLYSVPVSVLPQELVTGGSSVSESGDADDAGAEITAALANDPQASDVEVPAVFKQEAGQNATAEEVRYTSILTGLSIRHMLGITWLTGMCAYLAVNVLRALGTRRWLRQSRKPLQADLQAKVGDFFLARGFKILPKIWVIEDVNQPFVWGLLRGEIYLPADLLSIDGLEQQKSVLGHELSHVVRFDAGVSLLQVIAQAVFWFHPFVWWANLWIRREREKCCDEMTVAGLSAQPKDYSRAIVEALTLVGRRRSRRVPSLAIVGPTNNLEQRIRAILRPGRRFYRRPTFLVASAVLLIAAVTVPAGLVPQYRARGQVRIQPIIPRLVSRTDAGPIPLYERFVNTQVAIIKRPDVLNLVLERPDVQKTDWYIRPQRSLKQRLTRQAGTPLERLKDALSVQPQRRTEIVDVSFVDSSAEDATVIVNAVLDQYVSYAEEESDRTREDVYRQLVEQYEVLKSDMVHREITIAQLRKSLGTTEPEQLIAARRLRLDEIQARLSDLQRLITLLEFQMDQANSESDEKAAVPPDVESQPQYYTDPEWRKFDAQVRALRHQIANSLLPPKHPERVRIQKELEFAETLLRQREDQLDQQWRGRADNEIILITAIPDIGVDDSVKGVTSLKDRLALAKEEERLLTEEFERRQQEFQHLFETVQLLEKETTALQQKRELYFAVR